MPITYTKRKGIGLDVLDFDMRYPPKYGLIHDWFMYTEDTLLIIFRCLTSYTSGFRVSFEGWILGLE